MPRLAPMFSSVPDGRPPLEVDISSGELHVSAAPCLIGTVLGSCVAVAVFSPRRRLGGLNHYLLPDDGDDARHAGWAIPELVRRVVALGCMSQELRAKIFGGTSPVSAMRGKPGVGDANVEAARRLLADLGIKVVGERVGGDAGMRVILESWTGVVWVRMHQRRE